MKKNRFAGRCVRFFLGVVVFSTAVFSCKENSEDLIKPKTITDVLIENEQFSILWEIVTYAKMGDALRTDNLTFFAPDNDAFAKANISSSSKYTDQATAEAFIKNHIIAKEIIDYDNLKAGVKKSKNNKDLSITKIDSVVAINKSDIVKKNVNADNGIIHVIDSLVVN
ncbi:fasciclin domain-containing protein [Dyadobacter pollutisoli]|uniref:Fasciclin domain-containing protein n=1 Tax=Dyadobacter pollutisoli TaxID=2910158 RepID=A0A9E8N855_9BACT|nr:fasciclin domain-containing protein [Dyadobacter pollutisoli]WAC11674.1 fasciclin domain-containing protein [Dyadobacter pollutisoli]